MKNKSFIGTLVLLFTLGFTTSCEDMFEIESTRVVYEKDHNLNHSSDSLYTTLGILHNLQQIADRYVVLGEVRGDLVDVNKMTKTSLRNLSEFNFDADNEYLKVKDYYNVINNCNYALAHMDTTISHNNDPLMLDEYVGILSIRAWTYLQLAINYREVPFYTTPITTVADAEKDYPLYNVNQIAERLIPQLLPYMNYQLPSWSGLNVNGQSVPAKMLFPDVRLVLGDLYLWMGDYYNAAHTYMDYIMNNKEYRLTAGNEIAIKNLMWFNRAKLTTTKEMALRGSYSESNWSAYSQDVNTYVENLVVIPMQRTEESGTVSEVGSLFFSNEGNHQLVPSERIFELGKEQLYCYKAKTDDYEDKSYHTIVYAGDQRVLKAVSKRKIDDVEIPMINKFVGGNNNSNAVFEVYTPNIVLYRRALVYLRAAEALNCLAYETGEAKYAVQGFNLMKNAYLTFKDWTKHDKHTFDTEAETLEPMLYGVHARGCGDTYLDETNFTLAPAVIADHFGKATAEEVNFSDTLKFVEDKIIDELALETAFEGNRFGDLVRFAKRRGADYLAERVATRGGVEKRNDAMYNMLLDENNWYLPLK